MTWFKVDDKLHSHPKVMGAGDGEMTRLAAMGLWVLAGSYCADYMTDGVIDRVIVKRLSPKRGEKLAAALVDAGLWHPHERGWRFHDWADHQPLKREVQAERERKVEAGRRGGLRSGASRRATAISPDVAPLVKRAANAAVAMAVKAGDLTREPCEVCGSEESEAHHTDYTRPLEVRWLCREHHTAKHVLARNEARAYHSGSEVPNSRPVPSRPDPSGGEGASAQDPAPPATSTATGGDSASGARLRIARPPELIPEDFAATDETVAKCLMAARPDPRPLVADFVAHHRSKQTLSASWQDELFKWAGRQERFDRGRKYAAPAHNELDDLPYEDSLANGTGGHRG